MGSIIRIPQGADVASGSESASKQDIWAAYVPRPGKPSASGLPAKKAPPANVPPQPSRQPPVPQDPTPPMTKLASASGSAVLLEPVASSRQDFKVPPPTVLAGYPSGPPSTSCPVPASSPVPTQKKPPPMLKEHSGAPRQVGSAQGPGLPPKAPPPINASRPPVKAPPAFLLASSSQASSSPTTQVASSVPVKKPPPVPQVASSPPVKPLPTSASGSARSRSTSRPQHYVNPTRRQQMEQIQSKALGSFYAPITAASGPAQPSTSGAAQFPSASGAAQQPSASGPAQFPSASGPAQAMHPKVPSGVPTFNLTAGLAPPPKAAGGPPPPGPGAAPVGALQHAGHTVLHEAINAGEWFRAIELIQDYPHLASSLDVRTRRI